MVETSGWVELTKANPDHSAWYVERFRKMAAAGDDLAGEARLIDAMAPRAGRILDAGCGPGRVGAILAGLGHEIVGVDADPVLSPRRTTTTLGRRGWSAIWPNWNWRHSLLPRDSTSSCAPET